MLDNDTLLAFLPAPIQAIVSVAGPGLLYLIHSIEDYVDVPRLAGSDPKADINADRRPALDAGLG